MMEQKLKVLIVSVSAVVGLRFAGLTGKCSHTCIKTFPRGNQGPSKISLFINRQFAAQSDGFKKIFSSDELKKTNTYVSIKALINVTK